MIWKKNSSHFFGGQDFDLATLSQTSFEYEITEKKVGGEAGHKKVFLFATKSYTLTHAHRCTYHLWLSLVDWKFASFSDAYTMKQIEDVLRLATWLVPDMCSTEWWEAREEKKLLCIVQQYTVHTFGVEKRKENFNTLWKLTRDRNQLARWATTSLGPIAEQQLVKSVLGLSVKQDDERAKKKNKKLRIKGVHGVPCSHFRRTQYSNPSSGKRRIKSEQLLMSTGCYVSSWNRIRSLVEVTSKQK